MSRFDDPLNMLRGFLALAIIWGHHEKVPIAISGMDFFFLISFPGRIIVWIFFVISGYSIYYGYRNNKYALTFGDTMRFYHNRAIRILPLFYISTIVAWLCFIYVKPQDLPSWQSIVRTLFFMDFNLFNGIYSFTPTWFIGIIIYFYLFAPIIVKGYQMLKERMTLRETYLFMFALAVVGHWLGYLTAGSYDIRNFIGCFSLFLFGFLAYDIVHEHRIQSSIFKRMLESRIIYFVIFFLLELSFFIYSNGLFFILPMEGIIGSIACILVIVLAKGQVDSHRWNFFSQYLTKILQNIGCQSYGLYLWHGSIMVLILRSGFIGIYGPPFRSMTALAAAFVLTVIMSYAISVIFYSIVEKPYQNLYKKNQHVDLVRAK